MPDAFQRYHAIGGVLDFTAFETAESGEAAALRAIEAAFEAWGGINRDRLASIGGKPIDKARFFGDFADPATGALIQRGMARTKAGRCLRDPPLVELDHHHVVAAAWAAPETGHGGQFAYAFVNPPYGLRASGAEVQTLFDAVSAFLFPPDVFSEIRDWTDPSLPDVAPYFVPGMEWWGVFLFTVSVPSLRRICVIAGASTD